MRVVTRTQSSRFGTNTGPSIPTISDPHGLHVDAAGSATASSETQASLCDVYEPPSEPDRASPRVAYRTRLGTMISGTIEATLTERLLEEHKQRVNLIFTSPPFPLNRRKSYGNRVGDDYLQWLSSLAPRLTDLLTPDGSIVIEIGNSWDAGRPTMSTLPIQALLAFRQEADLQLCQQFVAHNPARLPGPAQWVTVERTRVKDSFTNIWWMSRTHRPKADNRQVLVEYSPAMKKLLASNTYNRGLRPSGHNIRGDSFLRDNGGAIPSNVLEFSNTRSFDPYRNYCIENNLPIHPARMSPDIAEFFIRMLTEEGDLILDPFSGSNITGAKAEELGRQWISVEPDHAFVIGSRGRFQALNHSENSTDDLQIS